jgi:hypothetical protein
MKHFSITGRPEYEARVLRRRALYAVDCGLNEYTINEESSPVDDSISIIECEWNGYGNQAS